MAFPNLKAYVFRFFWFGIDDVADVQAQDRLKKFCATVNFLAKHRFVPVKIQPHIQILCAATPEHEHDWKFIGLADSGQYSFCVRFVEREDSIVDLLTDNRAAPAKSLASGLQRVGNIGKV